MLLYVFITCVQHDMYIGKCNMLRLYARGKQREREREKYRKLLYVRTACLLVLMFSCELLKSSFPLRICFFFFVFLLFSRFSLLFSFSWCYCCGSWKVHCRSLTLDISSSNSSRMNVNARDACNERRETTVDSALYLYALYIFPSLFSFHRLLLGQHHQHHHSSICVYLCVVCTGIWCSSIALKHPSSFTVTYSLAYLLCMRGPAERRAFVRASTRLYICVQLSYAFCLA